MNKDYIVQKLQELNTVGKTTINIKEAAVPTGSGFNTGGEFVYTETFSNLRYVNPLRLGAMMRTEIGSAARWVAKVGDGTSNAGATGPWGYPQNNNLGNIDTRYWSLPMQDVNTIIPIRSWIFDDLPNFADAFMLDLEYELLQREGQSCAINNDVTPTPGTSQTATGSTATTAGPNGIGFQWTLTVPTGTAFTAGQGVTVAGATPAALNGTYAVIATTATTVTIYYPNNPGTYTSGTVTATPAGTTPTGAASGLRGLDSYTDGSTWAWGTSGDAPSATAGRHVLTTITQASTANIAYNDLTSLQNALPPQFWGMPSTYWQISPTKLNEIRQLKDSQGLPLLLDVGEDADLGQTNLLFGRPVIVNPYLSAKYPVYLANASRGFCFVDGAEIELSMYEQYIPGTTAVWAQKRVAFTVMDPSAVCRLKAF